MTAFNGMIIYYVKDDYNCIHMLRRTSMSKAKLVKYIAYIQQLKDKWKSHFIKAFVLNLDQEKPEYVWSTHEKIVEQNESISRNHQRHIDFLKENRPEMSFIGTYKAMRTKGMHLCKWGHEWFIQPIKVQRGEKCPKCENPPKFESHGVKDITSILVDEQIEFVKELCIDRFGINRKQFLDFVVCKNQYPLFVIEYNGIQHYKPQKNKHFGGYQNFQTVKRRDRFKRRALWEIGVPVIDIPYTESEEQIKETIDYFLRLYKLKE